MIPDFNMAGVIPPIRPGNPGHSNDRSPYESNIINVVSRFATSHERIEILKGFLSYRNEFYKLGVMQGFQWIDGSFCQDIENTELRPPGDIDVVTFFYVPTPQPEPFDDFVLNMENLLDSEITKPQFKVDAYGMQLGTVFSPHTVKQLGYWYSMWSHRKSDNMWKGFIQVALSREDDQIAIDILNNTEIQEEKL